MNLFEKAWWLDTIERVLYTMAETALGIIGSATLMDQVNWTLILSSVALSGIVTFLKCVVVIKK